MKSICDLLEMIDRHTTSQELFYTIIALAMVNTAAGVAYRAKKNNGDFLFMGKSYFSFELLNWNKYGIFALVPIMLVFGIVLTILFLPSLNRYCLG